MAGRVDGKVALVTGGGNGMGQAECVLLAQEGAKVAIGDIRDGDGQRVEAEITEAGGEAMFVHLDVTKEESWQSAVDQIVGRFGRLDILVNNAGISASSQGDPMGVQGWDTIMEVNAKGPFLGVRTAIPKMLEAGGGSIVNISSIAGIDAGGGGNSHVGYNASKAGVRLLTKAIAARHGKDNIRCNSVHPGIMPPMTSAVASHTEGYAPRLDALPIPRRGRVEEVAYGVLFLASDEASYITGTELVIDGGATCV